MLDLRTFDLHVLRPSQAILFGPRSALMTRLNGKSAALPHVLAQKAREREPCIARVASTGLHVANHARRNDLFIHGLDWFKLLKPLFILEYLLSTMQSFPRQSSCLRPTFRDGNRKSNQ
jgi:hypothetical protein